MAKYANGVKLYHYIFGPLTVVNCDEKYVETVINYPEGVVSGINTHEIKIFNLACVGHWVFEDEADVLKIDSEFEHGSTKIQYSAEKTHQRYANGIPTSKGKVTDVKVAGGKITDVKVMSSDEKNERGITDVKVAPTTGEVIKK